MYKLGIVGGKNSGKTTLIEQLIPLLIKKGIKAATAKHTSHAHNFDKPGKDTFRHREAGAMATLAVSSGEVALFGLHDETFLAECERLLASICDICLVEGNKLSPAPKILLTRELDKIEPESFKNIIATYGPNRTGSDIPHIDLDDLETLVNFICKMMESRDPDDKS